MEPLSGVPYVYVGEHLVVDHAVPVSGPGWFVIVTRRHVAALHELTPGEWSEIGEVLPRVVKALHEATGSEKEYVIQMAEAAGFEHVHWHVVARRPGDALRGTDVFQRLRPDDPLPASALEPLCDQVRALLGAS